MEEAYKALESGILDSLKKHEMMIGYSINEYDVYLHYQDINLFWYEEKQVPILLISLSDFRTKYQHEKAEIVNKGVAEVISKIKALYDDKLLDLMNPMGQKSILL